MNRHPARFGRFSGLLTALCVLAAGVTAQSPLSAAQAAPLSQQTTPAERGTPFRGIAIGDTQRQVNVALRELGLRCMTQEEKGFLIKRSFTLLEVLANVDACRIIGEKAYMRGGPDVVMYDANVLMFEMATLAFQYELVLENGIVREMHLPPSFFNAEVLDGWAFARSIADNYMTHDTAQISTTGITGRSPQGDFVAVRVSPNGRKALLIVKGADDAGTPRFD